MLFYCHSTLDTISFLQVRKLQFKEAIVLRYKRCHKVTTGTRSLDSPFSFRDTDDNVCKDTFIFMKVLYDRAHAVYNE
jgi:hypothetical protein